MRVAYCLIRDYPCYRRDAFVAGLIAAGFKIESRPPPKPANEGDLLVIWNSYGEFEIMANKFRNQGGTVIVAENGYLGFDKDGIQNYALALNGHNGSGQTPAGEYNRFEKLNLTPKAWRTEGVHLAIRGQRGIGSKLMASPPGWEHQLSAQLRKSSSRPIVIKPHPGNGAVSDTSHQEYLQNAHALLIWSSAVGVKALMMGIPVFYYAPHWICEVAAFKEYHHNKTPLMDDNLRLTALERMAWAQWSVAEITTGEPFLRLIELSNERQAA